MKAVKKKLLAFVLALAMVLPALSQAMPVAAEELASIPYDGDVVKFVKQDLESEFGMLSPQEGSSYKLEGDKVVLHIVPSNKTVYGGICWGSIKDVAAGQTTFDLAIDDDGMINWTLDKSYCGYATPIAPIKREAKGGGTSASQYYLAIPAEEKLPGYEPPVEADADYTAVDAALAKVPADLTVYTEESAKAVTDAVAAVVRDKKASEQAAVDAMAKAIEDAVAALELKPVEPEVPEIADGVYLLPDLKSGPGEMFNHFVADSKMLIVSGDTATIRFITDGSTASIRKYSRLALGKASELVKTAYQPDSDLPAGTTIIEGKLQPYTDGNVNKDRYLFEIPMNKTEVEALMANDREDDVYITIWNNVGSSADKVPGWYKSSSDFYLSLGALGEKTEAPAEAEGFGFTLQVGVYEEGQDFHTASLDGVTYALKDAAGNVYEPSSVSKGMLHYSNLSADNTYTFTASKEGWVVVKQGEWDVDAHAYKYEYTGESEINVTITKEYAEKNVSEYTHPGMVFRLPPREDNVVDKALAEVPEDLNYDLFTDETAKALKDAIAAADPLEKDEEKLNDMAKAVTDALHGLIPKDGAYEVDITKYNGTPYYLFEGLGDSDKAAGKAILVVENGQMTARIVLKNQSYGQVALGTKDEVIAAATAAGKVPEGTIDLEMPEEKQTINGKEYKVTTGTIPVPALFTKIDYAYHSSNTTKYTYNTGWYDHGAMFLGNTLKPTDVPSEEESDIINLDIFDEELMFKVVNAYVETKDGASELVFAMSGKGYEDFFVGTYEEAVANGANKANWVHFAPATVECVYETKSGKQNDGTAEKYQFRIPVTVETDGTTRIPIIAISNTRAKNAEKANPDNPDYAAANAFTARQFVIDWNAETLRTGNFQDTREAKVTSNIDTMKVEAAGEIYTLGTPAANEYTCQGTFTVSDKAYDAFFKGTADAAREASSGITEIGEDGVVVLRYYNGYGKTPEIDVKTFKVQVAFRVAETQEWMDREITIDPNNDTITIDGEEIAPAAADYTAVDEALAKVPEDMSAYTTKSAAAVTAAVKAVVRDLTADKQAEVDAMAKAIEDAVAALAKKAEKFAYDGDAVDFITKEGAGFGMWSLQDGSEFYLDGDKVVIHVVPSNKTVYKGFVWGDIGDIADGQTTFDEACAADGSIDLTLSTDYCGYAHPIAPIKGENKGGGTTGKQYYLAIPAKDKLPEKAADYTAVDEAIAKVPEDMSAYTEKTVKAVEEAVAAVDRSKKVSEQAEVDAMAKAIEDAIAALAEPFQVKDEQGNPVEPAEALTDPKDGDTFKGKDGKAYDVVSVGDPDPATGSVPVTVAEYTYSFITENAEWTKGSTTPLLMTAKRSRGDENTFKRFTGVLIDGAKLGENDYTAEAGSVKISIAPAYLETLSTGKHTVKALMQDGEAEAEFTIKAAQVKPDDKQDKPAGKDDKTVNTGDSNAVVVWVTMLVLAAAVCTVISAMYRRRAR